MRTFERSMRLIRKADRKVDELEFSLSKNWKYRHHSEMANDIVVELIKDIRDARMTRNALRSFQREIA